MKLALDQALHRAQVIMPFRTIRISASAIDSQGLYLERRPVSPKVDII